MKKLIATVLAFLSLMFCAYAPANAACSNCCNHGSSCCSRPACTNVCSKCAEPYTEPVRAKEEPKTQGSIANVIFHPFSILWRGAWWGFLALYLVFSPLFLLLLAVVRRSAQCAAVRLKRLLFTTKKTNSKSSFFKKHHFFFRGAFLC